MVVAQKVVSKAEGRIAALDGVEPSARAREIAGGRDPRESEVILRETARVVRSRNSLVIAETTHGFVCASAGVDHSNAGDPDTLVLLPVDPDASARRIRDAIQEHSGVNSRGARHRLVRPAVPPRDDGRRDRRRRPRSVARSARDAGPCWALLRSTQVALADELAAAADLVRVSKADGLPVVIVRGVAHDRREGTARELVMPPERDLFR